MTEENNKEYLATKLIRLKDESKQLVTVRARKKPKAETDPDSLHRLMEAIITEHSFEYKTLAEAKKTVCVDGLEYCFDALSLCGYSSNLTESTLHTLNKLLRNYCEERFDKEHKKERQERDSLFRFLMTDDCPYRHYRISKDVRPDFVLTGEQRVGIEVTELTSPNDQILKKISKNYYGRGMSAEEIKTAAVKHYKSAKNFEYKEIDGLASIWSGLVDLNKRRSVYSEQLLEKYKKYKEDIKAFDRFIILADAENPSEVSISCQDDVDDVFISLRENPAVKNATFVIIWQKSFETGRRVSYCDL